MCFFSGGRCRTDNLLTKHGDLHYHLLGAEKWSSNYMDSARESSCNNGRACMFKVASNYVDGLSI